MQKNGLNLLPLLWPRTGLWRNLLNSCYHFLFPCHWSSIFHKPGPCECESRLHGKEKLYHMAATSVQTGELHQPPEDHATSLTCPCLILVVLSLLFCEAQHQLCPLTFGSDHVAKVMLEPTPKSLILKSTCVLAGPPGQCRKFAVCFMPSTVLWSVPCPHPRDTGPANTHRSPVSAAQCLAHSAPLSLWVRRGFLACIYCYKLP